MRRMGLAKVRLDIIDKPQAGSSELDLEAWRTDHGSRRAGPPCYTFTNLGLEK